jgi:hypothetical protein
LTKRAGKNQRILRCGFGVTLSENAPTYVSKEFFLTVSRKMSLGVYLCMRLRLRVISLSGRGGERISERSEGSVQKEGKRKKRRKSEGPPTYPLSWTLVQIVRVIYIRFAKFCWKFTNVCTPLSSYESSLRSSKLKGKKEKKKKHKCKRKRKKRR